MYETDLLNVPYWIEELSRSIERCRASCYQNKVLLGYVFMAGLENSDKSKFIADPKHKNRFNDIFMRYSTSEYLHKKSIKYITSGKYAKVLVQNEIDKIGTLDYCDFFLYVALCLSVPGLFKSGMSIQETIRQFRSGRIKSSSFKNINLYQNKDNEVLKYILGSCLARFMEEYFGMETNQKLQHDILDKENTNNDIRKL